MAARTDHLVAPGARIRALREARGLSLRDLAALCGVSAPMLSQVERSETSPTLAVATKIAAGLGLSLSQLLRLDEASSVVVQRGTERRAVRRNGHRYEVLTPDLPGVRATLTQHTLKGGGRTGGPGTPVLHAPGSRETAFVQSGALALVIDDERYALSEGDSISFDADLPHHFENPSRAPATFLAVVTAGLREA